MGNVDASSLPGLESGQVATTPSGDLTNNPDAFNADGLNPGGLNPGGFGSAGSNAGLNPGSIASANLPSSSTSGGISSRAPSPNFSFTPLPSSTVRSSEPKPSVAPKPAAKPPATPAAKQSAPGDNAFADAKAELANAEAELAKNGDAARASAPNSSTSAGDNSAGDTIAAGGKPPARGPEESIATATAQSAPAPAPAPPKPPLPPRPMAAASAPFRQPTGANESTAIKTYFTSKWNPPADLQQSLQYQLILSGEGSIDKMNPLSPAAAQYAEKAGIPSVGEPFIPGSTEIQDATFVLTLGADGSVNVSVENVTPRR
ncbi:MAG: hypothetical protein HC771_17245 [Synechococcales cyanobacterium CRU_2_2]|nr:hypothetical protein [Synechococcales cyanobacterium CRU_2_2]